MSGLSPGHCGRSFHELYSCIRSLALKAVILTFAHAWDHVWSHSSCTSSWVALTRPCPTEVNTCDSSLDLNVRRGLSAHCSSICRERALHFLLIVLTPHPSPVLLVFCEKCDHGMDHWLWLLCSVTFLGKEKSNPPLDWKELEVKFFIYFYLSQIHILNFC